MRIFPYPKKNISIVIYGSNSCFFCQEAKKYLEKIGKKYKYYDIDDIVKYKLVKNKKEILDKLSNRIGDYSYIPIIFIKGKFIGGLTELKKEIS